MLFKGVEVSEKQENADFGPLLSGHGRMERAHVSSVHVCASMPVSDGKHAARVRSHWPCHPWEWVLGAVEFQNKVGFGSYELSASLPD